MSDFAFLHDDAEGLTAVLTAPDATTRCMGRLLATGIGGVLEKWLNAELARGTDPDQLLSVVAEVGMQHVASVTACAFRPTGDEKIKALLVKLTEERFLRYVAAIRAAAKKGGAA